MDELDRVVWLLRRFLDDPEDSARVVPTVGNVFESLTGQEPEH